MRSTRSSQNSKPGWRVCKDYIGKSCVLFGIGVSKQKDAPRLGPLEQGYWLFGVFQGSLYLDLEICAVDSLSLKYLYMSHTHMYVPYICVFSSSGDSVLQWLCWRAYFRHTNANC